jgi:hypothetical protein
MTANNATLPASWSLKPDQMPLMLRFLNPGDAYTVEDVPPEQFEAAYGAGVKLISE